MGEIEGEVRMLIFSAGQNRIGDFELFTVPS